MKNVMAMLCAVLVFSINLSVRADAKTKADTAKTKAIKVLYTCKMHPEVISDEPGKCPKCGMTLVKKTETKKASGTSKM
jgi:hypothetical protein